MTKMSGDPITKAAVRALESLLVSLETDVEEIADMPIWEVEEELRRLGLNPDRPLPHSIRELISARKDNAPPAETWSSVVFTKKISKQRDVQAKQVEGQTTGQPPTLAPAEQRAEHCDIRNHALGTRRFEDGDSLYRKGLDAYQGGHFARAIEYWRDAKIIFLSIGRKRQTAACDRSIGAAFARLGKSYVTLETVPEPVSDRLEMDTPHDIFEAARNSIVRARRIYLGMGLDSNDRSCQKELEAVSLELSGQSLR